MRAEWSLDHGSSDPRLEQASVADADELERLLDRRAAEAAAAQPFVIEFVSSSGARLGVGLRAPPGELRPPLCDSSGLPASDSQISSGRPGGHLLLISNRVKRALQEGEFTGWSSVPAVIVDRSGREVAKYDVLVIEGRSGPIRDDLSERVTLPARAPGGEPGPGLRGPVL